MNTASTRLGYRRPTSADADELYLLDNDIEVMRWINGGLAVARDWFDREQMPVYLANPDASPLGFWIVLADGKLVGWVSLRHTATEGEASIGYRLKRSAWGRGIATEAAGWLIGLGFDEAGLSTITATTYEQNHASRRVLEKLGMTVRQRFRLTETDLASQDTSLAGTDLWPGDDLLYELRQPG